MHLRSAFIPVHVVEYLLAMPENLLVNTPQQKIKYIIQSSYLYELKQERILIPAFMKLLNVSSSIKVSIDFKSKHSA